MRALCYAGSSEWLRQVKAAAEKLGAEPHAVVTSKQLAEEASKTFNHVYAAELPTYEPNTYIKLILRAAEELKPELAIFPCTGKGRTLAGLYAGARRTTVVSDVIDAEPLQNTLKLTRLVYGGTSRAVIEATPPTTICIVSGAFPEAEEELEGEIEWLEAPEAEVSAEFRPRKAEGVEPERADVVVAAGRGIKRREDLELVKELASALKGAWSVTRPLAADYGWAETWIGISGITVNPKLYLAIGVSGQPLHLVGARNSKIIAAINSDPNAPIFEEADYGIIGDLYQVVPTLLKKLKQRP